MPNNRKNKLLLTKKIIEYFKAALLKKNRFYFVSCSDN